MLDEGLRALVTHYGVEAPRKSGILLVDDERPNLMVLRGFLDGAYQVYEAESGKQALDIADKADLDVVITDQRMPEMTGVEMLEELRSRKPDVAGIVLTGFTDPPALISAINRARILRLRGGDVSLPPYLLQPLSGSMPAGAAMGRIYAYQDKEPRIDQSAVLFDSAEITGDVVIGAGSIIGAGVKILGDSHGPVRIGERVQILENTVLHLLPDNELVLEDGVVIGPGAMIHGCRIGHGTVVEPAAIVCDFSVVGAESLVRAGTLVKQRSRFPDRAVLEGFPAEQVGTLEAAPDFPNWGMRRSDLATLSRRR